MEFAVLTNTPFLGALASPVVAKPEHRSHRFRFSPFMTSTAAVAWNDRLLPSPPFPANSDTFRRLQGSDRSLSGYGRKLSLAATFHFLLDTARSSRCQGVPLRCQSGTSACFSGLPEDAVYGSSPIRFAHFRLRSA